MSIDSYQDLVGEVQDYLASEEIEVKASTLIQLAEATLNRRLDTLAQETRAEHITEPGNRYITVPNDYSGVRRLSLVTDLHRGPLKYVTPMALDAMFPDHTTSVPTHYTVEGVQITLGPVPDGDYVLEALYTRDLRPLTPDEPENSNWVLRQAPDIYLFQSLIQAEAFLLDDPRITVWQTMADRAIAELLKWDRDNRAPVDVSTVHDTPTRYIEHG